MKKEQILLAVITILCIPMTAWAINTPSSTAALQFQPYEFALGNQGDAFYDACNGMGYSVSAYRTEEASTSPTCRISSFISKISSGCGAIWISSHGSTAGFAVEAYDTSAAGLAARDASYTALVRGGIPTSWIYKGSSVDGNHISVTKAYIAAMFSSRQTIVFNMSCFAQTYESSWTGRRVALGWSGDGVYPSSANTFWDKMKDGKTIQEALSSCYVEVAGDQGTILAPQMTYCNRYFMDPIPPEGLDFELVFNCDCTGTSYVSSGPAIVESESWPSSTRYLAHITATGAGPIYLAGNFTSSNGISLHHPTNAWGLYAGDNSAADVSYGVVEHTAHWRVSSEYMTTAYYLEIASSVNGPWTRFGPEFQPGFGEYEMDISDAIAAGNSWSRICERETTGAIRILGYAQPTSAPTHEPSPPLTREQAEQLYLQQPLNSVGMPPSQLDPTIGRGQKEVIYTVQSLADAYEQYIAPIDRAKGYEVTIEVIPGYPSTAAKEDAQIAYLKSRIQANAAAGVKYHMIGGDDNDYHNFYGTRWPLYWSGSCWGPMRDSMLSRYKPQPDHLVIPAYTIPDTLPRHQNLSWWWPYVRSDYGYGQVGIVVTRLPTLTVADVILYSLVLGSANKYWAGPSGPMPIGLFTGDLDHLRLGDGAAAKAASDSTKTLLLAQGHHLSLIYESQVPDPETRNLMMADQWNHSRTNLNIMFASMSGPDYPGNMYSEREFGDHVWNMDLVSGYFNHHPFFLGMTCGVATTWATEDSVWGYGSPVAENMLFNQNGALGFYGPGCGSMTAVNKLVGYIASQYVLADRSRPIFENITLAQEYIVANYSDHPWVMRQLQTMQMLGSPLALLSPVAIPTGLLDDGPNIGTTILGQNYPNPFNPSTSISFYTPVAGQVKLRIFNLRGEVVCTLSNGRLESGWHRVTWNGRDDQQHSVASGAYFYRLEADDKSITKKLVLLK